MKRIATIILTTFLRYLIRGFGRMIYRLDCTGAAHVPAKGGALVIANHMSYLDFVILVCVVPRPVRFVMNADIFHKPFLRGILSMAGCIPVSPRGGRNDLSAFNEAVCAQLKAGHVVAIFPEGTVSRTGQMLQFRKGIVHLSRLAQVPIVPVHLDDLPGTPFTYRPGARRCVRFQWSSLRRRIHILFGPPLSGPVGLFELRQTMKELEAINFERRPRLNQPLALRFRKTLHRQPSGEWSFPDGSMAFSALTEKLAALGNTLDGLLRHERVVALQLPGSVDAMLLSLWCLQRGRTILVLDPALSNEEQYASLQLSGCTLLITHRGPARFAPTAPRVLFMEDIHAAINRRQPVAVCQLRNAISRLGLSRSPQPAHAVLFAERTPEGMRLNALSQRNLIATVESLRQVYHFRKGEEVLCSLPLHSSFGFVLQLLLPVLCDLRVIVPGSPADPAAFAEAWNFHRPPLVWCSPEQLNAIAATHERFPAPAATFFVADLDPLDPSCDQLRKRGHSVMTCLGHTSMGSVGAINLHDYLGKDIVGKDLSQENSAPGSFGKPLPGLAMRICRPGSTEAIGPGETGELWVRGAMVGQVLSAEQLAPTADGWLNTHLLLCMNEQGFLFPAGTMDRRKAA